MIFDWILLFEKNFGKVLVFSLFSHLLNAWIQRILPIISIKIIAFMRKDDKTHDALIR